MNSFFIIAAFNSFLFSVLLFQKKSRAKHDYILILWLVYLGLFIGIYLLNAERIVSLNRILLVSFISFFMIHGIFLYFYVQSLVSFKKRFKTKQLYHFIPFVLFNLYLLVISFIPSYSRSVTLEHLPEGHSLPIIFIFFLILTIFSGPVYIIFSIRLFSKHDINIFNNFSYSENIKLKWLRLLIYIFGVVWTALIAITVIHHIFDLFSTSFCTDGLFISLSVFVILIGYFGLKQRLIYQDLMETEHIISPNNKIKYAGSHLDERTAEIYVDKLTNLMHNSKPYLQAKLTLPQLAVELDISTHYLSQIINEKFKLNFFDYINNFRVEEVKKKMKDSSYMNFTLLAIALDSGFNSKSAFNRIFKKVTNLTPSQYHNSIER